jgi:predicted secreted protein
MSESDLNLNINDSGKSFEIQIGDVITVHLKENPTTPYRWELDNGSGNDVLSFVKSHYVLSESPQFGEGGMRSMTFKAISVGAANIQLKHWCKWEGDASIIEKFEAKITIRK